MGATNGNIEAFMAEVEQICSTDMRLTALAGAILAGISFDIAHDSRGLAKALEIEHALVLREVQTLVDLQRLQIIKRDERTQRCRYTAVGTPDLWPCADVPAE